MTALNKLNSFEWIVFVGKSTYFVLKRDKIIEEAKDVFEVKEEISPENLFASIFVSVLAISIKLDAEKSGSQDDEGLTVLGLSTDGKGEQLGPSFASDVFDALPDELKYVVSAAVSQKTSFFNSIVASGGVKA